MKPLKTFAAAVVAVLMMLFHIGAGVAQQSDQERLQHLEQELQKMQKELEEVKKDRMQAPGSMNDFLKHFPIKFKVSVTVRYDLTNVEDAEDLRLDSDEDGFRTRDRFSVFFAPDGPVNAGIRLTTGEDPNPASPFIRMGDLFRSESFQLDRFYISLRPGQFFDTRPFAEHRFQVSFIAGKMQNPFWSGSRGGWRSEIIWDTDVQPEGIALKLGLPKLLPFLGLESTTSYFIIEELDDLQFEGLTGDTYVVMTQLKAVVPYATLAFTFYDYERLNAGLRSPNFTPGSGAFVEPGEPAVLLRSGLQRTNNRITFGPGAIGFVEDNFQVINFAGQIYYPIPFPTLKPEIWLYGDYVNNTSVDEDDEGYGITIGVRGGGQGSVLGPFNLWFTYRDVDNDATLGTFADSDLCAGTGCKGFEFGANYRLHPNFLVQIVHVNFDGFPDKDNDVKRTFFDLVATF